MYELTENMHTFRERIMMHASVHITVGICCCSDKIGRELLHKVHCEVVALQEKLCNTNLFFLCVYRKPFLYSAVLKLQH